MMAELPLLRETARSGLLPVVAVLGAPFGPAQLLPRPARQTSLGRCSSRRTVGISPVQFQGIV
jgi:hypothetical protein